MFEIVEHKEYQLYKINKDNLDKISTVNPRRGYVIDDIGENNLAIKKFFLYIKGDNCAQKMFFTEGFKLKMDAFKNDEVSPVEFIPKNVESVFFMDGFNQVLKKDIFPSRVSSLHLYNIGPDVLNSDSIPSSVSELHLSDGFNHSIKGMIPKNVQRLYLYNVGEKVLLDSIPETIREINFMDGFNYSIKGFIPKTVRYIGFGNIGENVFSQIKSFPEYPIDGLTLLDGFNQPLLKGFLKDESYISFVKREGIDKITLNGIGSNVLQVGSIPKIKDLEFFGKFDQPLPKGIIPEELNYLSFKLSHKTILQEDSIPSTTKSIIFDFHFNQPLTKGLIPEGVENVHIYIIDKGVLQVGSFPNNLKKLTFKQRPKQPVIKGVISDNLETLEFSYVEPNTLEVGSIPSTTRTLKISNCDVQLINGIIPEGVEELTLGGLKPYDLSITTKKTFNVNYNYPFLQNIVPNLFSLVGVAMSYVFSMITGYKTKTEKVKQNVLIAGSLPISLKKLTIDDRQFDHPLSKGVIPEDLEELIISTSDRNIRHLFEEGSIPNNIKKVTLGKINKSLVDDKLIPASSEIVYK